MNRLDRINTCLEVANKAILIAIREAEKMIQEKPVKRPLLHILGDDIEIDTQEYQKQR